MPSYLDLGLIVVILISALLAMLRGFTREVLAIASWIAAAAAGAYLYPYLLPYVKPYVTKEPWASIASATAIFFVALIVVSIITVSLSDAILDSKVGALDRSLGFLFGVARGFILCVIAYVFFSMLDPLEKQPEWMRNAKMRPLLQSVGDDMTAMLQSMDEQPFLLRAHDDVVTGGIDYPRKLGALTNGDLEEIRARYWNRVREKITLAPGQRLVDKNPLNMLVLPLMRRLFPNARVILAIRHPCDVLVSCFLQNFRAPELALLCRDLPTLAIAYAQSFGYWYSQWPLLRPHSYELYYERLTSEFETEVRKLAEFLQLPWNDAMLDPGKSARAKGFVSTPSYAQVLEPINSRSVGRWQHYAPQFSGVLPTLTPWLERWGYTLS